MNLKNKNKISLLALNFVSQLFSFFLIWFLSRKLNVEVFSDFGKVSSAIAWVTSLTILNTGLIYQIKKSVLLKKISRYGVSILAYNTIIVLILLWLFEFVNNEFVTSINYYFITVVAFAFYSVGLSSLVQSRLIRSKKLRELGVFKLIQSLVSSIVIFFFSLIIGLNFASSNVIIFLYFLGYFISSVIFIKGDIKPYSIKRTVKFVFRERVYCLNSVANNLINSSSIHGVSYGMFFVFEEKYAAAFFLLSRIIGGPVSLVSNIASQIYISEVGGKIREHNYYQVLRIMYKYIISAFLVGVAGYLVLGFVLSLNFVAIFGNEWSFSQPILLPCIIYFFIRFTFIPIMQTLNLASHIKSMFYWELSRVSLLTILFLIFFIIELDITWFVYSLSLSFLFLYLQYINMVRRKLIKI
ncbi:hypothetical protein WOB69_07475 [Vibrio parahaemolyticus]|uniref:hypothetical protein n=1 Tax=Vibrio parahaemolyticus TaxID=670 RepID=UPI00186A8419|nr:hypothetical protein [Vibrio parahaemolyticus]